MTAVDTSWHRFRDDMQAGILANLPEHLARLTWSREKIAQAQRDGLRNLLRTAAENSPFHRRRLAGIDLEAVVPGDLSALPVMTKTQMMDALDDVFTNRRLRRVDIEAAIEDTRVQPVPVIDKYVALASGGSSGRRGVVVHDRASLGSFLAAVIRPSMARALAGGVPIAEGHITALVAAPSAVHATGLLAAFTAGDGAPCRIEMVPATLPISDIVERLNSMQPMALSGYASMLARLAAEARAGRLTISPVEVSSTSETLLPEIRSAVGEAFGISVIDGFGSTEGLVGTTAPGDDIFEFSTDMCIVELVDANNQPVPQGVPSTRVLLTNLYNLNQPLIRYELTDVFVREPDAPDHGRLRARVCGRSDDTLHYKDADIHPIVIRSVMVKSPDVLDYQVRQTPCGIEALVVTITEFNLDGLATRLRLALADAGLAQPDVRVRRVEELERHPNCGKLRRFVPLSQEL
jgi:phenylacetate-CoA ligase